MLSTSLLLGAAAAVAPPDAILVTARRDQPAARTVSTVTASELAGTPARTVADLVRLSPGVTVIAGNGPRDIGVSIRGSNARNSFGARNIRVLEDGFSVTQPDGLARFDLTDPRAYVAVDVVRGPSSARYGNYAIEGALEFRTRRGGDIDGVEAGADGGSYGYANLYAAVGAAGPRADYALFGSFVRADGATGHTGYHTGTLNGLATLALTPADRVTIKLIYNQGVFALSTRLSLDQYRINPYQRGCEAAETAAAGCGTISVFVNGRNGTRIAQTAAEGGLARDDQRAIAGVRWEHDLSDATTWRTQALFDARDVYQPTSATPFRGTLDSHAFRSDVDSSGRLLGTDMSGSAGLFYERLDNRSYSFNKTPAGRDGFGALQQTVFGTVRNIGARANGEVALTRTLTATAGVGAERSTIDVTQAGYAYPLAGPSTITLIPATRHFTNVAPEAALAWQATRAVRLQTRIGTAYGIPQAGSLFVTPDGRPGNNAALKTQKNTGVDAGIEVAIADTLKAEATGFYEWFRNEQVTQSAGVNLLAYTTNAPRSVHRGVELGLDWRPLPRLLPGARILASYSYDDQRYTRFVERLSTATLSAALDRAGNRIPGVIPHFVNARLIYDRGSGRLAGLGGFVEVTHRSRYAIDNGNRLSVPQATLLNLDLHWKPGQASPLSRLSFYVAVQNLLDRTTVGSASVIADGLDTSGREKDAVALSAVTGSIYAGQPRTVFGGVKVRL